jgi:tripeptide aminopeptidase
MALTRTASGPPLPSKVREPAPSSPALSGAGVSASPFQALSALAAVPLPDRPRTTLNIGQISGGTSINSIPESATALLDLRSTDSNQLQVTEARLRQTLSAYPVTIEVIGDRPAAALPDEAAILRTLRAVDRHLNLRTELRIGSTDANIPLSLGIPAMAIGTGGTGGGIHTMAEWYDPTGRELALRRILLTLLATVATDPQAS